MNFLGMGPMELMVILVLALIIFGPGKLPEIAGQVGKVVRDFRRTTAELSSEFNRTLSLEIEERKTARRPRRPLRRPRTRQLRDCRGRCRRPSPSRPRRRPTSPSP